MIKLSKHRMRVTLEVGNLLQRHMLIVEVCINIRKE